jgi:hypothetical protein
VIGTISLTNKLTAQLKQHGNCTGETLGSRVITKPATQHNNEVIRILAAEAQFDMAAAKISTCTLATIKCCRNVRRFI